MCGRYNLITDAQALVDFFEIENILFDPDELGPRYNIAPSQSVPIVRMGEKGRELLLARWGLVPHWSREEKPKYSTINARAETVAEKPTYRESFKKCAKGRRTDRTSHGAWPSRHSRTFSTGRTHCLARGKETMRMGRMAGVDPSSSTPAKRRRAARPVRGGADPGGHGAAGGGQVLGGEPLSARPLKGRWHEAPDGG